MVILDYILSQKKESGKLPENGAVVTTIVSGKMAGEMTKAYGMTLIETLTGFKYIGEQIRMFEQDNGYQYVFGYEESYGCLTGTHARDKDAVAAVLALCEAAAYCKSKGMTLADRMEQLFETYGYFKEDLCTVTLAGEDGIQKISQIMESIRKKTQRQICGQNVIEFRDYLEGVKQNLKSGKKDAAGLPKSDVLYFELEDNSWFCVRPSGTEPKIKFYAGVKGSSKEDADKKLGQLMDAVRQLAK